MEDEEIGDEEFTKEELDLLDLIAQMIVSSVINKNKAQQSELPQEAKKEE
jgi:hypothetical protein